MPAHQTLPDTDEPPRRRVAVDTALCAESTFADLNTVIRDTCNRFSRITGWTLTFQPAENELADELEQRLRSDQDCFWFERVRSGFSTIGIMSVGRARQRCLQRDPRGGPGHSRLRRTVFPLPEACDAAEIVVRLLNQIATRSQVLELAEPNNAAIQDNFDRNAQRRLDVLRFLSGYDAVAVFLADEQQLSLLATSGIDECDIPHPCRELQAESFDQQAIVTGQAILMSEGDLVPSGYGHALCFPLDRRSKDLGTVWFYSISEHRSSECMQQAQSLSGRFAGTFDDLAVRRITRDNTQMKRELRQLGRIQAAAERNAPPIDKSLDFSFFTTGRSEVNGDLCEYISLDDHRTFVAIGDACGHGLPAAVITTTVRGCLRCLIHTNDRPDPADILQTIGDALSSTTPTYMFMTLLVGVVDTQANTFQYSSAGHPSPLILRRHGSAALLDGTGLLLGVMEQTDYQNMETTLLPGDVIVAFSDGITEARNGESVMFQTSGVQRAAEEANSPDAASEEIVEAVLTAVKSHSPESLPDDATVIVLKRRFSQQSPEPVALDSGQIDAGGQFLN